MAKDLTMVLGLLAARHQDLAWLRPQATCRAHALLAALSVGGMQKRLNAENSRRIPGHAPLVVAVELVIWWVVAVGLWMASLSGYSGHELLLAVALGFPAALTALVARRAVHGSWSVPRDALRWMLFLPVAVVVDAARVLALPLRRPRRRGGLRWLDVKAGGDRSAATGRRALATLFISSTPGSYVVAADEDAGSLLIHAIGSPNPVEKAVRT